jgi:outer membrane biosynthesis protein TonB
MRRGALISVLFHAAILAAVYFGLPHWFAPEDLQQPVPVQLATMADITTPPKQEQPTPAPTPVEKPKPPEPKPTPPPPQPQAETPPPEPPPPTPPVPEPEPQPEVVPPEPVPDETVQEPKPAEEQPAEPEPPKVVPQQKPKPPQDKPVEKPKPQEDALATLLKNVEQMKEPTEPTQTPPQPNQQPTQPLTQQNLSDAPMTMSEIDAIRQQLAKCWNVPAGARDAQNLAVEIRVMFNPDGSVARAEIVDTSRMASDAFYRTAAESAYRAVLLCSPLQQMPVKKYNTWKNVTLNFDPREMVGQ